MADALLDPFRTGIAQRALAELVILGAAAGPLGVWMLLHRRTYAAESLSHGLLPGLVLAALAGAPLALGAAAGALVAAAAIALAGRAARVGGDAGVAVAVTTLFGLGGLLALAPDAPPRLEELLFGDVLGVSGGDLAVAVVLCAGVLVALAAAHRPLLASSLDPGGAAGLGIRAGRAEALLLFLLAVTVVAAIQALGNLLVLALLVAPSAAALRLTRRLPSALAAGAALGILAGVGGLYASYELDMAAGAAIALTALAIAAVAWLMPERSGASPPAPGATPSRAGAPPPATPTPPGSPPGSPAAAR